MLPYQPDVIKAFTDGWRYGTAADMTSMNEETLAAICEEAHKNGLEVLTHTVTLEKAKIVARLEDSWFDWKAFIQGTLTFPPRSKPDSSTI